jgi:hypothetical protein
VQVQVLTPLRLGPGPHAKAQSTSVPEMHAPVLTAQASRQSFPALAVDDSEQVVPAALQASFAQQIWLAAPQATQLPSEQTLSAAVQVLPVQQGCAICPQETAQRWPLPHDSPAMQPPHSTTVPEH